MRISPSCYAVTGLYFLPPWGVNAGFVVGKEKSMIIDSGANYLSAQTIYGYALSVKESNTFLVINTEKHLDHIGGNSFFADKGTDIYGHNQILRQEEDIKYLIEEFNLCNLNSVRRGNNEVAILFSKTRVVNPSKKIFCDMELDLGDLKVQIITTPGHTDTNISVYIPSEGVLYCGDCIVDRFIPNLEEGTVGDWQTWKKSLGKIKGISPTIVVPGHGNIISGQDDIKQEIKRLEIILDEAITTGKLPTIR